MKVVLLYQTSPTIAQKFDRKCKWIFLVCNVSHCTINSTHKKSPYTHIKHSPPVAQIAGLSVLPIVSTTWLPRRLSRSSHWPVLWIQVVCTGQLPNRPYAQVTRLAPSCRTVHCMSVVGRGRVAVLINASASQSSLHYFRAISVGTAHTLCNAV